MRPRGLPIGNLTSQLWVNCYLNPFDHFIQREMRCRGYVRYVDDGLVFADDKRSLWRWREAIVTRLGRLRLTIHPGAHPGRASRASRLYRALGQVEKAREAYQSALGIAERLSQAEPERADYQRGPGNLAVEGRGGPKNPEASNFWRRGSG